jgi:UDP-N-acetylglucosamine--N-acetylmuramyl-(pentapeptide) pyrophosphoryl-undecaprenol N-acetylglucosamine transferase
MSSQPAYVVFAGGGTGGHLFPGLAVASELRLAEPSLKIAFSGAGQAWECEQVARSGYEYLSTPCGPWPGRRWSAGRFLVRNALGYYASLRFLRRHRVAVVIGLGGYASAPMARAAVSCGIPLVLLEQNALPGKVNRWLAPSARLACAAFEESRAYLRSTRAFCLTGNPIRRDPATIAGPNVPRALQLLVVGGSRGSRSLNQHVPRALARARLAAQGWSIVHQAGPAEAAETQSLYEACGLRATVVPFIDDLPATLASSRLAICRAGGSTLAELAAAGTPAILCPYPQAADDHQRRNAASYAAAGACFVVDEQDPPGSFSERLSVAVTRLATDQELWRQLAAALLRLARPLAARHIAELILERAGRCPHFTHR